MNKTVGVFLSIFASFQVHAADVPWINGAAEFQAANGEAISTFVRETFDQPEKFKADLKKHAKGGKRTDAVLLFKDGKLVFEKYDREMTPNTRHISWSMSKSVMSLLFGVALKEKRFQFDDSICKYVSPPRERLCEIKIKDVLQWATGLDWIEDYEKALNPLYSSVLNLLYGQGHRDMARFVLGHNLIWKPGTAWRYSSGDSVLASFLLRKIWQRDEISAVFQEKIFGPIGVNQSFFEEDPTGTVMGASYLQVTPYDLARIGFFVMNNGKWGETQILDSTWMAWAKTPSPAYIADTLKLDGGYFGGGHWWTNDNIAAHRDKPTFEGLPTDTFYAMGHWGQYLIVIPSEKVIAIRLGDCRDGQVEVGTFASSVAKLLAATKGSK